jgi:sugar-specific transcriptional regulator TrmB
VIKALVDLSLSRLEAEVYVYLAKKGPQTIVNLSKALNISRQKVYSSIKYLQTKGLVSKDRTIFSALPFNEALELLIEEQEKEERFLKEVREELVGNWMNSS